MKIWPVLISPGAFSLLVHSSFLTIRALHIYSHPKKIVPCVSSIGTCSILQMFDAVFPFSWIFWPSNFVMISVVNAVASPSAFLSLPCSRCGPSVKGSCWSEPWFCCHGPIFRVGVGVGVGGGGGGGVCGVGLRAADGVIQLSLCYDKSASLLLQNPAILAFFPLKLSLFSTANLMLFGTLPMVVSDVPKGYVEEYELVWLWGLSFRLH